MIRLPAEWEPQRGVMLAWPHEMSDWKAMLFEVERVYIELAEHITARETLLIICYDLTHQRHIDALLSAANADEQHLRYAVVETNDTWIRDYGPVSILEDDKPRLLDFRFNGWGNKHPAGKDNLVNRALRQQGYFGDTTLETVDFVLEGGSIDSNGNGLLLSTTQCLLTDTRNPTYNKADTEAVLAGRFGISQALWLDHGRLEGDDTDGHIDTLARFCDERTIVYTACNDQHDSHYTELNAMRRELETHAENLSLQLTALPLPEPQYNRAGQRLPATYANFLIINDAVLVPTYGSNTDSDALTIIGTCFPQRQIIGIDCVPLIQQFGSLHCVTMQLPRDVPLTAPEVNP